MSPGRRRGMVDREHLSLSTARQCALLGVACSSLYYRPMESSCEDLALTQAMDRQYLNTPFYGSRRMSVWLTREGRRVSRKGVQRLMRIMEMRAIYRSPRTSRPAPGASINVHCVRHPPGPAPVVQARVCSPIGPNPGQPPRRIRSDGMEAHPVRIRFRQSVLW